MEGLRAGNDNVGTADTAFQTDRMAMYTVCDTPVGHEVNPPTALLLVPSKS